MQIRKRTSKSVAKRHDLDYFKKGSPVRLWQWRLAVLMLLCALGWFGVQAWRGANVFSAGPISASHAVFGQKCEVCHVPVMKGAGWLPVIGARRKVADSACLSCHQMAGHHAEVAAKSVSCSTCHVEHSGLMHMAAVANGGCTQCHADLQLKNASVPAAMAHVRSFVEGHPEITPLKDVSADAREKMFGLKFNHADHMQKNLRGARGEGTTLTCASCHHVTEGGVMAPVKFERDCRSCHSLEFDKHVAEEAPHGDAAAALRFVEQRMTAGLHDEKDSLVRAETILFREKCALCHTVAGSAEMPVLKAALASAPVITPVLQLVRWFASARFSHDAHQAVRCEDCHEQALTSVSGKDLLMPNVKTCQRCHDGQSSPQGPALASGHAESGCFLCHVYHAGAHGEGAGRAFRLDELAPVR